MRILADTSILIDLLRGRGHRRDLFKRLTLEGHTFAVTAINVSEIYAGMRPQEREATRKLLAAFECLPIHCEIAELAGELRGAWARKGVTLHLADTLIAASAMHHRLVLMTDNRKDFPMPELQLWPEA
ncbi:MULTISPECIES: type II toxin-antitoxin system VapC family toxin [Acidobacterium]|uniref:type II toxin-antitoxin system VapC family toxin n=1 Tax=Acidobacterium TaxID=33973 RepID=UPI0002D29734|nr:MULTISPECIES: type II toxin-antitoxin system VapC family toxin [Acidobacterium]